MPRHPCAAPAPRRRDVSQPRQPRAPLLHRPEAPLRALPKRLGQPCLLAAFSLKHLYRSRKPSAGGEDEGDLDEGDDETEDEPADGEPTGAAPPAASADPKSPGNSSGGDNPA
ncbi:MAG: hypothetical protein IT372_17450 [Polyangiaceae bacterium]|nr:hypothetical protein [Polyangiaceae bacterium]